MKAGKVNFHISSLFNKYSILGRTTQQNNLYRCQNSNNPSHLTLVIRCRWNFIHPLIITRVSCSAYPPPVFGHSSRRALHTWTKNYKWEMKTTKSSKLAQRKSNGQNQLTALQCNHKGIRLNWYLSEGSLPGISTKRSWSHNICKNVSLQSCSTDWQTPANLSMYSDTWNKFKHNWTK